MKTLIDQLKTHLSWSWVKDRCISILIASAAFLILWLYAEVSLRSVNVQAHLPLNVRVPLALNLESTDLPYEDELLLFSSQISKAYGIPRKRSDKFSHWILLGSAYSNVPEILLASLIMTESSFREAVVSHAGAVGPGQIKMVFWGEKCPNADTDPQANITCAGLVLRHYYDDYCDQNWSCALQTYNVGPRNYRFSKSHKKASTRYLKKITKYASLLDNGGDKYNEDLLSSSL